MFALSNIIHRHGASGRKITQLEFPRYHVHFPVSKCIPVSLCYQYSNSLITTVTHNYFHYLPKRTFWYILSLWPISSIIVEDENIHCI